MKVRISTLNIETQIGSTYLRDDGIIHYTAKNRSMDVLATAKANVKAIRQVAFYQKRPLLADIRGNVYQSKESKAYYTSDEMAKYFSGIALIIGNGIYSVKENFFMGLYQPKVPTKLFTSEVKAIEWLKMLINEK
ncbi:MAG: hypothetical protein COC01_10210 [Bacteroidetes bacterium]|nr:MAG: hypothetical protein COC01_10210 [Bacteroidota bacterium]